MAAIQIFLHTFHKDIVELLHITDFGTDFEKHALMKDRPKIAL